MYAEVPVAENTSCGHDTYFPLLHGRWIASEYSSWMSRGKSSPPPVKRLFIRTGEWSPAGTWRWPARSRFSPPMLPCVERRASIR